jgi:site-specific recombinase XerD|tara:strand:+ start:461 stop:1042 length:582 start_codon:yes stop_codon:yes gene_type:complete
MKLELPTTKVIYKLPEILSPGEVQRIIKATPNIKHKTLLMVIYSTGLRVSEAVNLKRKDIDSARMTLHIRETKNNKERYVILSKIIYTRLRQYWKSCPFKEIVFPGQQAERAMTTRTAAAIYKQAKADAGIEKAGGIHALRHAFATHMFEAGENIFIIKELLGHASIHSTVRYLRFIPDKTTKVKSPIELLDL